MPEESAAGQRVGQLPALIQLVGGVLVMAGVVVVKLGEPAVEEEQLIVPV